MLQEKQQSEDVSQPARVRLRPVLGVQQLGDVVKHHRLVGFLFLLPGQRQRPGEFAACRFEFAARAFNRAQGL